MSVLKTNLICKVRFKMTSHLIPSDNGEDIFINFFSVNAISNQVKELLLSFCLVE